MISPELLDSTIFGFPLLYYVIFVFTMTTGTMFLMWIGEQITEKGIETESASSSHGYCFPTPYGCRIDISTIEFRFPRTRLMNFSSILVLATVFVFVTVATILIIQDIEEFLSNMHAVFVGRKEVQGEIHIFLLKSTTQG